MTRQLSHQVIDPAQLLGRKHDAAVGLTVDLREVARMTDALDQLETRLTALKKRHPRRRADLDKVKRALQPADTSEHSFAVAVPQQYV